MNFCFQKAVLRWVITLGLASSIGAFWGIQSGKAICRNQSDVPGWGAESDCTDQFVLCPGGSCTSEIIHFDCTGNSCAPLGCSGCGLNSGASCDPYGCAGLTCWGSCTP